MTIAVRSGEHDTRSPENERASERLPTQRGCNKAVWQQGACGTSRRRRSAGSTGELGRLLSRGVFLATACRRLTREGARRGPSGAGPSGAAPRRCSADRGKGGRGAPRQETGRKKGPPTESSVPVMRRRTSRALSFPTLASPASSQSERHHLGRGERWILSSPQTTYQGGSKLTWRHRLTRPVINHNRGSSASGLLLGCVLG